MSSNDSNLNSIDDWLARASGPSERSDLGFTLNEAKVKDALSGLTKVYPNLWFLHLMQLLYELGPQMRGWFCESDDSWELRIQAPSPEFWDRLLGCDWNAVNPLGSRLENKLARLKMELGADGYEADFRVENILSAVIPKSKINWLKNLNEKNLTWMSAYGCLNLGQLEPKPTEEKSAWFTPWRNSDDKELWQTRYWCDFESVKPADDWFSGFPWSYVALGQNMGEMGPGLFFHPIEQSRGFASQLIFGHYPPRLSEAISLESKYETWSTQVERVLGIFWGPLVRNPSQIRPVIKGVLGAPVFLPDFPAGFLCYAEAGHLKTDLSGLALVNDGSYQFWLQDVRNWIKEQAQVYLPLYPKVRPYLWSQVKSRDELSSYVSSAPPEKRFRTIRFLHKVFGEDLVREKRARELSEWLKG